MVRTGGREREGERRDREGGEETVGGEEKGGRGGEGWEGGEGGEGGHEGGRIAHFTLPYNQIRQC